MDMIGWMIRVIEIFLLNVVLMTSYNAALSTLNSSIFKLGRMNDHEYLDEPYKTLPL